LTEEAGPSCSEGNGRKAVSSNTLNYGNNYKEHFAISNKTERRQIVNGKKGRLENISSGSP
jgi:hypothetical protein